MNYHLIGIVLVMAIFLVIAHYAESMDRKKDPYEIGNHMYYSIVCENGFIYKVLSNRRGVIQILNSDGTPLRCGEEKY